MTRGEGTEEAKRRAGERAAATVEDDTTVGLGTGSTAAYAIEALGRRVADGLCIRGIPTSLQARRLAREAGITLTSLDAIETIDLAIDGADQVADGTLVKGGGGAHAREKVVDAAAETFLVVVDASKVVETLDHPVPVEVLPFAIDTVTDAIAVRGGDPTLRKAERKDGPVVTDNGNLLLDCDFGSIPDPGTLASDLSQIPGVVDHGLFVDLADTVYVGHDDGVDVDTV